MKVAKEKVWKTADGKLVPDGDDKAAFLVAPKGQLVPDAYVTGFKNADDFFEDINPHKDHPVNIGQTGTETDPGASNVGVAPKDESDDEDDAKPKGKAKKK